MTTLELIERSQAFDRQMVADKAEVVRIARGLVAVLRDAQRENSAKELEQALFILDAHEHETAEFGRQNLEFILNAIRESGGPPR